MSNERLCNRCGIKASGAFCPRCGFRFEENSSTTAQPVAGSTSHTQLGGLQKFLNDSKRRETIEKLSSWEFGIGTSVAVFISTLLTWSTIYGGQISLKGWGDFAWGKVMFFVSIVQILAFLFIKFRESTDEVRVRLDFAHGVIAAVFLLGIVITGTWVNADSRTIAYGYPVAVIATLLAAATSAARIAIDLASGIATSKAKVVRVETVIQQAPPVAPSPNDVSTAEALQKFFDLKESGAISNEEYEAQKRKILGL